MRSNTTLFAGLALALACTACGTPDFGHRSEVVDADQRLDTLLEAWRESRESGRQSAARPTSSSTPNEPATRSSASRSNTRATRGP
ncbi:MAG: hypothetical protein RIR65_773 [Planctomycetota bacterium]|jgi:hypothetical protein